MQLLFRVARLVSCRHQVDEKFHDKARWFPAAAGRIGQFKRSGSTKRHPGHDVTPLACALAGSPTCVPPPIADPVHLSSCRKASLTNQVNRQQNQILLARLRLVGCQRLPDVRLGNPKLSRNPRGRDASLECCTNGIHLTTCQRDFGDVYGSSLGLVLCGRPFHRQVRSDVEPMT